MDTRDLEYVLAINVHGGIGRAAVAMGVTQPALTKAVKRIEMQLGLRLFERSARGMSPTSAGELFIDRARLIHRDYEDTLKQMRAVQSGTQGVLSLGYSPSVPDAMVLDACRQLIIDRPAAQLRLRRMLAPALLDLLTEGSLDLAMAPVPKQGAEEFAVRELFNDRLTVIADEAHTAAAQAKAEARRSGGARLAVAGFPRHRAATSGCRVSQARPTTAYLADRDRLQQAPHSLTLFGVRNC